MSEPIIFSEFKRGEINFVTVGEKEYVVLDSWKTQGKGIYNFKTKPDDVFIMTLPRSGTTMTLEMVWLLLNNLDYKTAKKIRLDERIYELETSLYLERWQEPKIAIKSENNPTEFVSVDCDKNKYSYEVYENIPGPKIIKTHLPFSLYKNLKNSGAKTIYIARDPKDRLVSWWRFLTTGDNPLWKCDFKEIWEHVKTKKISFGPVWSHLEEGWTLRNDPNVLFLFYEDIRTKLHVTIKKVANFLGKYYTDEEIEGLVRHLDIDNFRNNSMVNSLTGLSSTNSCFIGQGKIGGYKDVIPDDIDREIDEWIIENLKVCNINFPSLKNKNA